MAKLVHEHSPRGRSRWRDHRSLHLRGGRRQPDFPELRSPPSLSGLETRQSIRNQLARKGSAADVAGIKIGDVIKSYDDTKVISHHELIRAIGEYPIGKTVVLGFWRAGAMKSASLEIQELSQDLWETYKSNTIHEPRFNKISDFGLELEDMSARRRKQHNISSKFDGPVVKKIVREGAADNADLSVGDVLRKVGLSDVKTAADFARLMIEARDRGSRDVLILVGGPRGSRWTTLPLRLGTTTVVVSRRPNQNQEK